MAHASPGTQESGGGPGRGSRRLAYRLPVLLLLSCAARLVCAGAPISQKVQKSWVAFAAAHDGFAANLDLDLVPSGHRVKPTAAENGGRAWERRRHPASSLSWTWDLLVLPVLLYLASSVRRDRRPPSVVLSFVASAVFLLIPGASNVRLKTS